MQPQRRRTKKSSPLRRRGPRLPTRSLQALGRPCLHRCQRPPSRPGGSAWGLTLQRRTRRGRFRAAGCQGHWVPRGPAQREADRAAGLRASVQPQHRKQGPLAAVSLMQRNTPLLPQPACPRAFRSFRPCGGATHCRTSPSPGLRPSAAAVAPPSGRGQPCCHSPKVLLRAARARRLARPPEEKGGGVGGEARAARVFFLFACWRARN